ncbi:MAG: cytidine deaminase [Bacteroides sp.]|nr:cytidine deaminase [Bacteroides sp.]
MKERRIEISYKVYAINELDAQDNNLVKAAIEATQRSYAPYSNFHVGAAALLENGVIVTGTNQENVAYPSGLCAERTTLFYANSQYPDAAVKTLAIATCDSENTLSPCGACRQVMAETEKRYGKPMRILLCGKTEVYVVESAADLLPFTFHF